MRLSPREEENTHCWVARRRGRPAGLVNPLLHQQFINRFDYHPILHQQFINMFDYLRYFESKSVLNSTTEIVLEWTQIQPVGGVR